MSTTYTNQPAEGDALDTFIYAFTATTNYATNVSMYIGHATASGSAGRALIKDPFTGIPAEATIISAVLTLTYKDKTYCSNARTLRVFRSKRDWVEAQATWNIWKTSNNWSTAGGFHSDDCEQTDIGSASIPASPTIDSSIDITLDASKIQEMIDGTFTNNGFLLKNDTENADMMWYHSASATTASFRPKLVIVYETEAKQVSVTIPLGPWGTSARKIYRTVAGDSGNWKLVGTVSDNTTATFTDNIADASLGADAPSGNTSGSRPQFPRQNFKIWAEAKTNSALTQTIDAAEVLAAYWIQASPANSDTAEFNLYLEAGTYTIDVMGVKDSTCGKVDWYLDGISISTGQDWYAASITRNTKQTISSVSVTGNGYHVLKAVVNGKNGSAGTPYYNLKMTSVNVYQASL